MIICPQCGASNSDDVKFCDRCGQGLAGAAARPAAAATLPPLTAGTELKSGLRVIELIGSTSHENRYRAERRSSDGKVEHLQLREQIGPPPAAAEDAASPDDTEQGSGATSAQGENPAGPHAKTADLKLKPPPTPPSSSPASPSSTASPASTAVPTTTASATRTAFAASIASSASTASAAATAAAAAASPTRTASPAATVSPSSSTSPASALRHAAQKPDAAETHAPDDLRDTDELRGADQMREADHQLKDAHDRFDAGGLVIAAQGTSDTSDNIDKLANAQHNGTDYQATDAGEDPEATRAETDISKRTEVEDFTLTAGQPAAEALATPSTASAEASPDATPQTATAAPEAVPQPDTPRTSAGSAPAPIATAPAQPLQPVQPLQDDLGEVFGRVMALSMTLNHLAFQRAIDGFAENGRVYLAYRDEQLTPLSRRRGGLRMSEADAIAVAIQVCQAVAFVNRRGLRVNDICPDSVAVSVDGRIRLTGLDCFSNDNELQAEPLFNDGYTAPEIYKARKVDKRADVFSVGALLYTCLTGERLESETWREEAGPIRFYPPHVVSPALEQVVRRALLFDSAARWPNVDALKAELVRLAGIIRLRAAVLTDVGMVRELNEDSIMAVEFQRDSLIEPAQNFLYVVADGMGGAEAGEMASAIAVGTIRSFVEAKLEARFSGEIRQLLTEALEEANRKILDYQAVNIESRGMGSTAVSALIVPPEAAVAWVGDSRAYFCDQGGLRQLTKDHSLVQRLIEIGQITPEEARHHEHKNVITRSLGARQSGPAGAEALSLRLKRGDRLLLCSDGLTAHVDDPSIGAILRRHSDPYEAARELVVAANAGGGTDNVSVVVIFAD